MKKGVHLLVKGRVQGVGFRYFVYHSAQRSDLSGWVKNLEDGRVEIVAEGEEETLRLFVKEIAKGSRFAAVKEVQTEWQSYTNKFRSFEIVA